MMHAHSSKVEYQKNDCFIGSAFLAEKVRTPPRKFLWWCFFDDGLPKPPLCRKEAAKPRSTEFCVSLVGVDVPGDPRSAMFCFLSGYACFMLLLWFDNYSFLQSKGRSFSGRRDVDPYMVGRLYGDNFSNGSPR